MNILLSNDDGFDSPGLMLLYEELKKSHQVTVVAPSRERSTVGHSLTLHKPLRVHHVADDIYHVSGSPADCVYMATRHILKTKPDILISGINRGANLGHDIFYSGTMAAAREGYLFGIRALATSLCIGFPERKDHEKPEWMAAVNVVSSLLSKLENSEIWKDKWLMNLNIPNSPEPSPIIWSRQGHRFYSNETLEHRDPRGKPYYWIGGGPIGYDKTPGTDCVDVAKGFAALTPLKVDTTNDELIKKYQQHLKFSSH